MKTKILFVLLLLIGTTCANAQKIKMSQLLESAFTWTQQRASIEDVDKYLKQYNVSAYKGAMVIITTDDEEWLIEAKVDSYKKIEWMALTYRINNTTLIALKAVAIGKVLSYSQPYMLSNTDNDRERSIILLDSPTKKNIRAEIFVSDYDSRWQSGLLRLTFISK